MNSWCILRSSGKLKTAIKYIMERDKLDYKDLAAYAKVRPYRISNYLNNIHKGGYPSITQSQIIAICEKMGISATLNVEFK